MIHYNHCPICGAPSIHPVLEVKDNTVSGKTFAVWHCDSCTGRFTQDIPGKEEIGAYYQSSDYISHSDTREGLVNRLYHQVRAITLNTKRRMVQAATRRSTGTLLDLGCGTGAFLHVMEKAGWHVTGLEPDPGAREKAASLYGLRIQPIEALAHLEPASFNAITLWHVLEHVHDLGEYIEQCKRLLVPGGAILIAVPNYLSLDAQHYGSSWAAYDVPRHLYHFSPRSMERLLDKHHLESVSKLQMWFDSFYVSMLSERYATGHNRTAAAVWTGLRSNLRAIRNAENCSSVIYVARATARRVPLGQAT